MNNLVLAAQAIKDAVSAQDVGEALGLEIRHGRCKCPMHGGNDFNCVLYKQKNRGYYCHVCKSGGDVLSFVQQYHGLSFKDTVAWFNDTFHLGLDIESKMDPEAAKRAEISLKMRREARELAEWKDRMQFDLFLAADKVLYTLEEQREENMPKRPDDEWNPQFCNAVRLIPEAKKFAEYCMSKCVKGENK